MEHMLDKDVERVLFSEEELHRRVAGSPPRSTGTTQGGSPCWSAYCGAPSCLWRTWCAIAPALHRGLHGGVLLWGGHGPAPGRSGSSRICSEHIEGRDVIVVEDILDSGNTLSYLLQLLQARSPASVRLCTLLDKPSRRTKEVELHYSGFTIPDYFVVGYGLDYAEKYRNLPYIRHPQAPGVRRRGITGA